MSTQSADYVAKAVAGTGWRIWNRRTKRWWGNFFKDYPKKALDELNGAKRPDTLSELARPSYTEKKKLR
jgi:hypothetical protein